MNFPVKCAVRQDMELIRPSFQDIYMKLALNISRRSTCARLKVGCVITSTDHRYVYAVGYNGSAEGGPNDCDRHGDAAVGNCGCIHSEANAIINNTTERSKSKFVYCTTYPCVACSKMLINLGGVQVVYYLHDYRVKESPNWLHEADIETQQLQLEP